MIKKSSSSSKSVLVICLMSLSTFVFSQDLTIGSQTWASENLSVLNYQNGDPIIEGSNSTTWRNACNEQKGAYCVYNGQVLYNWYAVNDPRGLAPSGYNVPSVDDWHDLFLGLGGIELEKGVLKKAGFYKTGAGSRDALTGVSGYGSWCSWWSTDKSDDRHAYSCIVYIGLKGAHLYPGYYENGLSVRCIKSD